jgi:hypothetical protein
MELGLRLTDVSKIQAAEIQIFGSANRRKRVDKI